MLRPPSLGVARPAEVLMKKELKLFTRELAKKLWVRPKS